jgi:membrane peptidoglycan carboxypeptidase
LRNRQLTNGWIARRRARNRAPGWSQHAEHAGLGLALILVAVFAGALLAAGFVYARVTANLPPAGRLQELLTPGTGLLAQPTRLYDRSGQHVIYTLENPGISRRSLPLDPEKPEHFSPLLVQMIVAADDPSFWRHAGVTIKSLPSQTPVTIAEKLVDRFLLDQEPPSWQRAVRMHLLAAQITAHYGRGQVLEWYLNSIPFGHTAYGADSAAQLYLNKPATDLSLAETALLIAVEQAPALNPLDSPKAALERQAAVLDTLLTSGFINDMDYMRARAAQLRLRPDLVSPPEPAGAYARLVLNELEGRISRERLERGGLRIFTTLDYDLQLNLDCAARTQLLRLQNKRGTPSRADGQPCSTAGLLPPQPANTATVPDGVLASAVVLDLQKGEVLGYVGPLTADGKSGAVIYQPGSLLTPYVALAGFSRGIGPASMVWDIPSSLPKDLNGQANPDERFHGPARMRLAIANDYLAPIAQLLEQIGSQTVWRLAAPLGLTGLDGSDQGKQGEVIYRGGNVSLLEMAQSYAVLSNLGVEVGSAVTGLDELEAGSGLRPVTVQLVQANDGQVLMVEPGAQSVAVLDAPLAYLVHNILADDDARRSTSGFRDTLDIGRPSAGKLGVADGGRQVWTAGYTPQRLAVTWLGLPGGETTAKLDSHIAAGLWNAAMRTATNGLPAAGWREPQGISHVEVCDPSGLLPSAACPNRVSEVFLNGNEPVEVDSLYRLVQINRESGRLATAFTPPALIDEKTFMIPPTEAEQWAKENKIPQPPSDYDPVLDSSPSKDCSIYEPNPFTFVHDRVTVNGTAAGDGFASYRLEVGSGLNPQQWLLVGQETSQPVQNGKLGEWDTTGLDGLYTIRLEVTRADNSVELDSVQVTVDNTSPEVKVLIPQSGQTLRSGEGTLQVSATDNLDVTRVEVFIDGIMIGSRSAAPYSIFWNAIPGKHTMTVKAFDAAGNVGETQPVEFEVK